MPLFPAFIDLSDKEVLVVGGGRVAKRKIDKILEFTKNVTVVAPRVVKDVRELAKKGIIKLRKRKFLTSDLKGKALVIVAVDDLKLQERVFELCNKKGILCNSVDSPKLCNFIFPSLIVRGDVVVGISTSGKAPALSGRLRELIESCMPEDIEETLKYLEYIRSSMEKGEERQRKLVELARELVPLKER